MFARPVAVRIDGRIVVAEDARQARDLLSQRWPERRGPRHRDAFETCLKVIDGHRSSVDAEARFREAAEEAGILAETDAASPRNS
ncbi:DUF982 domain-containing protein [Mesorhizobium sp. LHD-90]|uniref:DUF982 domain-containing protein n=1 Tax=Mesorhizobium sp. LHD-90 TaxID=3071414 RepID=UPI0027E0AD4B|nr:DUF982 domain-containing protein [Mesorhizobium sp. LHD-90]MDQ6434560.1 DUF982 domain-containing protein [Mesorhizobium sp. LHD-90]